MGTLINVRGKYVEYRSVGKSDKVALILNGGHTNCDSPFGHENLFVKLGYRLIIPSRPGYGKTPSRSGKTAEEFADTIYSFLNQLGIDSVVLVGVSAAGRTALQFAGRYPLRVNKLILQSAIVLDDFPDKVTKATSYLIFNPLVEKFTWGLIRAFSKITPDIMLREFMSGLSTLKPDVVLSQLTPTERRSILDFILISRSGSGFLNDLKHRCGDLDRITAPTLVIDSKFDGSKSPLHAEYAISNIHNSELMASNAESHLIWFSKENSEIESKITEFLMM